MNVDEAKAIVQADMPDRAVAYSDVVRPVEAGRVLMAEVERLRRERDVAIHEGGHTPSRIAYGYDADRDEKGYFVDNVWAGKEYLDAVKMIAACAAIDAKPRKWRRWPAK